MVQSLEASLRRLKTDRVDLLWAHAADNTTPIEEIMRAFDDLVRSGKVLHVGLSNFPAWRVATGTTIAAMRGWAPLVAIQAEYSLVERGAERDLLPMAEGFGLGVLGYSPLGGGVLTGNTAVERAAAHRVPSASSSTAKKTATRQRFSMLWRPSPEKPPQLQRK